MSFCAVSLASIDRSFSGIMCPFTTNDENTRDLKAKHRSSVEALSGIVPY